MPVRLGTVAPIGFDTFPRQTWLARLGRLGCTVVQAYRRQDAGLAAAQMKDYIDAGGLPCDSLHGLFGPSLDPSSPDEATRQFAIETYRSEGDLARQLGGSLVVVHCSPKLEAPLGPDEYRRRRECLRRSVEQLGAVGERIGVTYAFENLPPGYGVGADPADVANLLDEAAVPNTAMCFDTGHALMTGDPVGAIEACAGQIAYVHFSDNDGTADQHLMPTRGALDTVAVADALAGAGFSGTLMLEVFRPVEVLDEMIASGMGAELAAILARASAPR